MLAAEFDQALAEGRLKLAFVGMSNVGKTSRAKALHEAGLCTHHDVDGRIMQELGMRHMHEMAAWLGYPDSEGYGERERRYLELEKKYTLEAGTLGGNVILDTTGSAVHLSNDALSKLKDSFFVVHLDVGEEALADLVERYFATPKPVVWGEYFAREDGETTDAALRRSYPILLSERLKRFRELADLNVHAYYVDLSDPEGILASIRSRLSVQA